MFVVMHLTSLGLSYAGLIGPRGAFHILGYPFYFYLLVAMNTYKRAGEMCFYCTFPLVATPI